MRFLEIERLVKTPELDVVRVVSLRGDEVLLVKEVDDENWKLPGGKIHEGETIFEAFQREIEEELGFKPIRADISNYLATNIPHSENIRHIFLIRELEDGEIKQTDEVEVAEYFPIDALPETKFKEHISSAVAMISG